MATKGIIMTVNIWKYTDGYYSIGEEGELKTFCPSWEIAEQVWLKIYRQRPLKIDGNQFIRLIHRNSMGYEAKNDETDYRLKD